MSFEQIGFQLGGGALLSYVTGWGLKKLLHIIIKLVAIVLAAFFGGLLWLEVQKIVTVNWKELGSQASNSLGLIADATISTGQTNNTLGQIVDALGIPFTGPLGLAFVVGFMKG